MVRAGDRQNGLGGADAPVLVRHRYAYRIGAERGVRVPGSDRARLAGCAAARLGRAVTPIHHVYPGRVAHTGITEAGAERIRGPGGGRLVRPGGHRRRDVGDTRRGGGRGAPSATRVRDGQGHRVAAVVGVGVSRPDAGAAGAVAETPRIRDRVSVRVRGGAAVERDATALDIDRKSTRLNSSHTVISYAVFCLKK